MRQRDGYDRGGTRSQRESARSSTWRVRSGDCRGDCHRFLPDRPGFRAHGDAHRLDEYCRALAAVALLGRHRETPGSAGGLSTLWIATGGQLAVLWFSHSPILHHATQSHSAAAAAVHGVLFIAALVFWVSIVNSVRWRWHAILALLISGKLACLLGALLVFSPRLIYGAHAPLASDAAALADQHLAGLLMVIACPLSFVLTAIVLAAQVLSDVSTSGSAVPLDRNPIGQ